MPDETNVSAPSTREPFPDTAAILRRIEGEFREMPGLRLTEPQARRLWALDATTCSALLELLIAANFLFRTTDGAFMRVEQPGPLKARASARPSGLSAA